MFNQEVLIDLMYQSTNELFSIIIICKIPSSIFHVKCISKFVTQTAIIVKITIIFLYRSMFLLKTFLEQNTDFFFVKLLNNCPSVNKAFSIIFIYSYSEEDTLLQYLQLLIKSSQSLEIVLNISYIYINFLLLTSFLINVLIFLNYCVNTSFTFNASICSVIYEQT